MKSEFKTSIAKAQLHEADEISALVNSAYRGESSRQGWTTEADYLDGQRTDADLIREEIRHPQRLMLCLRDQADGKLLGTVLLEKLRLEKTCSLGMLTTRPDLQNSGLGKRLITAAEKQARDWGCDRMVLGVVHCRETLIAWYERRGYRSTGETKPFPYGQEKFGIPRVNGLHFRLFSKSLEPAAEVMPLI